MTCRRFYVAQGLMLPMTRNSAHTLSISVVMIHIAECCKRPFYVRRRRLTSSGRRFALLPAYAHREHGQGHDWLGTTGGRVIFWAPPAGAVVFALPVQPNPAGVWAAVLAGALALIVIAAENRQESASKRQERPWGALAAGKGVKAIRRLPSARCLGCCAGCGSP